MCIIRAEFLNELDDIFEVEPGTITPDTRFKELEEWDSVTLLSLVAIFEEEFEIVISNDTIEISNTIMELVKSSENK